MSKPTKYYSELQENRVSSYLGWKTVVGSGATATRPGDIISDQWLGECKTHTKKTDKIIFKIDHWQKIKKEAQSKFKYPVLVTDNGTQEIKDTWCLIDYNLYCPPEANIVANNVNYRSNLTFDINYLNDAYHILEDYPCRILQVVFDGGTLGVVSLTEFKEYFL